MCVYKYHESKDDKEREKYFNEFNYWYASATALMRFFNFIDNNNSRENISEIEGEFQQKYFVYLILPDVKKKE
jgi:hypothetical protein